MNIDAKLNRYRPSQDALLNPCHDEVFKALFTNESEESRTALHCFLTAVLHKEVKTVQLRPNEPPVVKYTDSYFSGTTQDWCTGRRTAGKLEFGTEMVYVFPECR